MTDEDFRALSDKELEDLRNRVLIETDRRNVVATLPNQIAALAEQLETLSGGTPYAMEAARRGIERARAAFEKNQTEDIE